MKTVLFVIKRLDKFGGAERVMVNLANAFAERGKSVFLATFVGTGCVYPLSEKVRLLELNAEKNDKLGFHAIKAAHKLFKELAPDCVISFHYDFNFIALLASMGSKAKIIVSERNDPRLTPKKKLYRLIRRILYPFADGYVFQTDEARDYFPHRMQRHSAVIPNPIRDDLPDNRDKCFEKLIVTGGRLVPQKRHDILIEAFAALPPTLSDYRLIIYGEGKCRKELSDLIDRLRLKERVILPGAVKDLPEKIRNASVFVLTSDYEGIPNALAEAMALGIPCVATRCPCGGPELLICDSENGLLTPVGDVKAVSAALTRILTEPQLMRKLSDNARAVNITFSLDKIATAWLKFLDSETSA